MCYDSEYTFQLTAIASGKFDTKNNPGEVLSFWRFTSKLF